ncbi:MAG: MBL fold metallo-hydrolase [Cyclobacteriaceae bacterium]|nr:MBL fold metallo-hydrolase [Cyclobacteriaceae bacterium]
MLRIKKFTFNPFGENTYVLFDDSKECVVIDPGCYEKAEQQELTAFIDSNQLVVKRLLNTHCHIDHVLGNAFVKRKFNVGLFINAIEEPLLRAVKSYASNYGFFQYEDSVADGFLTEKDVVAFGEQKLQILFVPGHSPGHIAFYDEASKILVGGDVLFENSIGRTDLPGGNFNTLINSIHEKFFTLPDDVTVYCGHGEETSIGFEKRTNPFCAITQ